MEFLNIVLPDEFPLGPLPRKGSIVSPHRFAAWNVYRLAERGKFNW